MKFANVPRLSLAHTPTPLWRNERLNALVGTRLWVKRDDMTAGAAAGNKIRKLEFLLAEAKREGADHVVTCGGAQSNHARATALCCAQLGMTTSLLLRSAHPEREKYTGNLFLDRLANSSIHWVSPSEYRDREEHMQRIAQQEQSKGRTVYLIPEGGSNALGSLGYVAAMAELKHQLGESLDPACPESFDAIFVACGSGGTAAGLSVGASAYAIAPAVHAMAVCDDSTHFLQVLARLTGQIRSLATDLPEPVSTQVDDQFVGPGYGVATEEQHKFIQQVAGCSGLVLDPVYSGKAFYGLRHSVQRLGLEHKQVLFVHTGGLPGLLA